MKFDPAESAGGDIKRIDAGTRGSARTCGVEYCDLEGHQRVGAGRIIVCRADVDLTARAPWPGNRPG